MARVAAEDPAARALAQRRLVLGEDAVEVDAGPVGDVALGEGAERRAERHDARAQKPERLRELSVQERAEQHVLSEDADLDDPRVAAEEVGDGDGGAHGEHRAEDALARRPPREDGARP